MTEAHSAAGVLRVSAHSGPQSAIARIGSPRMETMFLDAKSVGKPRIYIDPAALRHMSVQELEAVVTAAQAALQAKKE